MLPLRQLEFTSAHHRNPSENCVLGADVRLADANQDLTAVAITDCCRRRTLLGHPLPRIRLSERWVFSRNVGLLSLHLLPCEERFVWSRQVVSSFSLKADKSVWTSFWHQSRVEDAVRANRDLTPRKADGEIRELVHTAEITVEPIEGFLEPWREGESVAGFE
jgi:hypothetical protein